MRQRIDSGKRGMKGYTGLLCPVSPGGEIPPLVTWPVDPVEDLRSSSGVYCGDLLLADKLGLKARSERSPLTNTLAGPCKAQSSATSAFQAINIDILRLRISVKRSTKLMACVTSAESG
jgi:hypothetical protein